MPGSTARAFLTSLLLAAAAALLAACGGGGDDLTGDPEVPEGYATYRGSGVSFAYPEGWQVEERRTAAGAPEVRITAPDRARTPAGLIRLAITPGAGERFESFVDQRRVVVEDANGGKIESDEPVELAGAERALRAKTTYPPGQGTDPVEVRTQSLDVLRGDDIVILTAASPDREDVGLDPAVVISSFRLARP